MVEKETTMIQALKDYLEKERNSLMTAIAHIYFEHYDNDDDFVSALGDVCTHGAMDCGYFTYTTESNNFFSKYKEEINAYLTEELEEFGYKSIVDLIPKIDFEGDPLLLEPNSHQWICWYIFEVISQRFAHELELDD